MNSEARHERLPETPKHIDYNQVLESVKYIADQGFSVYIILQEVRDEVIATLKLSSADSRDANRLLDVMNDIDAMLEAIENPTQ